MTWWVSSFHPCPVSCEFRGVRAHRSRSLPNLHKAGWDGGKKDWVSRWSSCDSHLPPRWWSLHPQPLRSAVLLVASWAIVGLIPHLLTIRSWFNQVLVFLCWSRMELSFIYWMLIYTSYISATSHNKTSNRKKTVVLEVFSHATIGTSWYVFLITGISLTVGAIAATAVICALIKRCVLVPLIFSLWSFWILFI